VDKLELKNGEPFKFSARVEVRSQVTPQDYSGVPLTRRAATVTDEQISADLEAYRRRLTEYKPIEGRTHTGPSDVVLAEVNGRVGEHRIKHRTAAIDLEDDVGGPLPGLASRLVGVPIGTDPIEIKYTIPADSPQPELAGKPVDLRVTVKEVREKKIPALDDELAKDTGEAETLEALRGKVRERLLESDQQRVRQELVQQLLKELIKRNEFPIAKALVERHAQVMVSRAKRQFQAAGLDVDAMDDARMIAEFMEPAEAEARGGVLIHAIAEREGITVSDADLQKRIAELASARNENPKKMRAELEKEQTLPQLESQIREQKTLDMLIAQAKITDEDPASAKLIVTPGEAKAEQAKSATDEGKAAASPRKKKTKEPTP
jgi:trigger factor